MAGSGAGFRHPHAIFSSANEGILVYDRELKIVAGNQAAERIIGLPLPEIIGKAGFTAMLPCVRLSICNSFTRVLPVPRRAAARYMLSSRRAGMS